MKKATRPFVDFLMNVLTSGTFTQFEIGTRSRIIFLNAVNIAGGFMLAIFSVLSFSTGKVPLAMSTGISSAIVLLNSVLIRITKKFNLGGVIDCFLIFGLYFYLTLSGGESGSGVLWIMTYPLITLFILGSMWGSIVALSFGACVAIALFVPSLNAAHFASLYSARVLGTYVFIWIFSLIYETVRKDTQAKLLGANQKLSRLTDELRAGKKQTDNIMSTVQEGIFLLDKGLCFGTSYSRHFEALLERGDLAGIKILDVLEPALSAQDLEAARDFFELFMGGKVNDALLADINPLSEIRCAFKSDDGTYVTKYLRFSFLKITDPEDEFIVLGVVSDATEEVALKGQLEQEAKEHRRSMESLFQIIHVDPLMMKEFIADTEAELEAVNDLMKNERASGNEILDSLFQSAHAIKGNALLLGLEEFAIKTHEFEDDIKEKREKGHQWRDLLELTIGLGTLRKELENLKDLITKILSFQAETKAVGLSEGSLFQYSLEKLVKRESEKTGAPVGIEFRGFGKRGIPDKHRKIVKDVLVQLIRNSFAHAFETPQEREARGKPATSRIELSVEWRDGSYLIRYRDDGRGLDIERIKAKALGIPDLADKAGKLTGPELVRLIFHPGFSTANGQGMDAGRGVGMSLVRNRICEANGRISIKSAQGRGLEISFELPFVGEAALAS